MKNRRLWYIGRRARDLTAWIARHPGGRDPLLQAEGTDCHLFPSVHYSHYPALAPLVREACAELGLPYHASWSIWGAVAKHHRLLRQQSAP